jgi:beta-phosphoglucomutase-like phosphatase (HAD superfamily)
MSWRENLDAIFAALDFDFRQVLDGIVTAGEVQRGKPDPEIFLRAAERLGVPPERCVVVEDAPAGLEAARRAGMRSIGVSAEALLPAALQADYTAPSLLALPADIFDRLIPA